MENDRANLAQSSDKLSEELETVREESKKERWQRLSVEMEIGNLREKNEALRKTLEERRAEVNALKAEIAAVAERESSLKRDFSQGKSILSANTHARIHSPNARTPTNLEQQRK